VKPNGAATQGSKLPRRCTIPNPGGIRDVEVGPDGALWMLEDSSSGGLFRVTPK